MRKSVKWASIPDYTERGSGGKPSFAEYCGRLGTDEPRVSPLISKPEACKLLAGGGAPATPPASDPTETMHPEGVPEADVMPSSSHERTILNAKTSRRSNTSTVAGSRHWTAGQFVGQATSLLAEKDSCSDRHDVYRRPLSKVSCISDCGPPARGLCTQQRPDRTANASGFDVYRPGTRE